MGAFGSIPGLTVTRVCECRSKETVHSLIAPYFDRRRSSGSPTLQRNPGWDALWLQSINSLGEKSPFGCYFSKVSI